MHHAKVPPATALFLFFATSLNLVFLIGCEESVKIDRPVDFYKTRLAVTAGSAEEAAVESANELRNLKKLNNELKALSMETSEASNALTVQQRRLKNLSLK